MQLNSHFLNEGNTFKETILKFKNKREWYDP